MVFPSERKAQRAVPIRAENFLSGEPFLLEAKLLWYYFFPVEKERASKLALDELAYFEGSYP